jgi:hypothetical protein
MQQARGLLHAGIAHQQKALRHAAGLFLLAGS